MTDKEVIELVEHHRLVNNEKALLMDAPHCIWYIAKTELCDDILKALAERGKK